MAFDQQDRTEKPTAKRRNKARREGRVARSSEIGQAAGLVAAVGALALTGPKLLAGCEAIVGDGLLRSGTPGVLGAAGGHELVSWSLRAFAAAVAPVALAAAAAGIVSNVAQVGFKVTPKALAPSFKKLNPAAGLKRMFSPSQSVELLKSIAKTAVIGWAAFDAVWPKIPTMGLLVGMSPGEILSYTGHLVLSVAIRVGAVLLVIAALDYVWQRYRHEKSLKMTKEDVKRESRESDVAPEVRGQIRRRQAEQARKRMLAEVPTADVVIVNPTHFAVALRYDGSRPAPEVVAKGVDLVAQTIRRVAEEAGVPIVHEPPLARALYRDVDLGQLIPEELFAAVAQVLAFVFRTARRRQRQLAPA